MKSPGAATVAAAAIAVTLAGCFGYNPSAKRWAYVGDAVLIAGGGGVIASDVTTQEPPCMGDNCVYRPSLHGALVVGAVLATAGLVGIVLNLTRDEVKTSR